MEFAIGAALALFVFSIVGAFSAKQVKALLIGLIGLVAGGALPLVLFPNAGWGLLFYIPIGALIGFMLCWIWALIRLKSSGKPLLPGKARVAVPILAGFALLSLYIYNDPQILADFAAEHGRRRTFSLLERLGVPAGEYSEDDMFLQTPPEDQEALLLNMLTARDRFWGYSGWYQSREQILEKLCNEYDRPDLLPAAVTFLTTKTPPESEDFLWALLDGNRINRECLQQLHDAGFSFDMTSSHYGVSLLEHAARTDNWKRFALLLDYKPDLTRKDAFGRTVLFPVVVYGKYDLLERLMGMGAPVDTVDGNGRTLLHTAAFAGRTKSVRLLLQAGLDPNAKDLDGATPLLLACFAGGAPVVTMPALRGVSVNQRDSLGNTPLSIAKNKEFDLYAGGTPSPLDDSPDAGRAWERRQRHTRKWASFENPDYHEPPPDPADPTGTAAALLRAGADPQAVDSLGRNAMHYAALRDALHSDEAREKALIRALQAAGAHE